MEWVAVHMAVNPLICIKCGSWQVTDSYGSFPLCEKCFKQVMKAQKTDLDKDTQRNLQTVAAVFAKLPDPPPPHSQTCVERRTRHSYRIHTPVGYLNYDGSYGKGDLWTRKEKDQWVRLLNAEGTPTSVTREIRS